MQCHIVGADHILRITADCSNNLHYINEQVGVVGVPAPMPQFYVLCV